MLGRCMVPALPWSKGTLAEAVIKEKKMFKLTGNVLPRFSLLFIALSLAACGGGGGSSGSEPKAQSTDLKPGVFDIGRIFSDGSTKEGISFLSPTGKFVAILDLVDFGTLTFSDSGQFSGPIEEYNLAVFSGPTSGTLSGEVVSSKEANLTASRSDLTSNGVLLRNDEHSDLGVTFEELSAVYTVINSTSLITIGPTGEVTGGDRGCDFYGQVVIPDKTINVFEVTYEASNCPPLPAEGEDATAMARNGEFTGLGTYDPSGGELLFYAHNGTVAWMFKGTR